MKRGVGSKSSWPSVDRTSEVTREGSYWIPLNTIQD